MFTYDGRGGVHRGNNGNSSPTKSQGYLFNSGRRRNHGHGHGNRHQHQHHHHHQHQHQHHGQSHANGPVLQTNDAPEPVRPPNAHADKLINLLKTSGEYDRLRKQIFSTFQNSDMRKVLLSRVDGVVTECLEKDRQLLSRPPDLTHADLMKELDTYPFVERQVLCVPIWRDDEWISQIEHAIYNLIHERPVDAPSASEPVEPPPALPPFPPFPPPNAMARPPPSTLLRRPPAAALARNQNLGPAPWRVPETAPVYVPEEMDQGLGEDDMAIDDD